MIAILAGSSKLTQFYHFLNTVNSCPFRDEITQVYSGDGTGADQMGIRWAEYKHFPVRRFKAEWHNFDLPMVSRKWRGGKEYNSAAGIYRTHLMVDGAEAYMAVWNGVSPGTKEGIEYSRKKGLLIHVFRYTCPKCREELASLLLCPKCGIRYQVKELILGE